MKIAGSTVLVTGANRGIGAELASHALSAQPAVHLAAR